MAHRHLTPRVIALAAVALAATASTTFADTGAWKNPASGFWSDPNNWIQGIVAGGTDAVAFFSATLVADTTVTVDLPLSNECKRVLAYGAEEAERLNHKHIGTEHLLLGLLREEKCFAAEILTERGLRLPAIREELTGQLLNFLPELVEQHGPVGKVVPDPRRLFRGHECLARIRELIDIHALKRDRPGAVKKGIPAITSRCQEQRRSQNHQPHIGLAVGDRLGRFRGSRRGSRRRRW